jgi:hypothetical protein
MKRAEITPRSLPGLALLVLSFVPTVALAQPRTGQVAAGADIGAFIPKEAQLDPGWIADGFIEFYVTPRVGIRPILTFIRTGYDRPDDDDERQLRLGVDVIHNWEGGRLHPFVGAGIGVHFLEFHRGGRREGRDDRELGANVLGGLEVFLDTDWAVKFEARYQWVGDRPGIDPDGLGLLIGLKRYF